MPTRTDIQGKSIYSHWPVANTEATITLAAPGANKVWIIEQVEYGFTKAPAAVKELGVAVAGTTVLKLPVIAGGPLSFKPESGVMGDANEAIIVSLAADSGGALGYLNVMAHVDNVF